MAANDTPLPAPQKGDPITAAWATAIADAINARGTGDPNANGTATPYGTMLPANTDTLMEAPGPQAMPFDAAIIREGADGDALYMALPNAPDYVYIGKNAISPDSAQTVGNAQNAWTRIEAVTHGSARRVYLAFTPPQSGGGSPGWRLFVSASATPSYPAWADKSRPLVLLAGYNIAADDSSGNNVAGGDTPSLLVGLVQYHRGAVYIGGGAQDDPIFLDCKIRLQEDDGQPAYHLLMYIPDGTAPWSIRVNGKETTLGFDPNDMDGDWLDLGAIDASTSAVWLVPEEVPDPDGDGTYHGATNWIPGNTIVWQIDTHGDEYQPSVIPANAPDSFWPRFLHPVLVAEIRGQTLESKHVVQTRHGSVEISSEVGDADGTHDGTSSGNGGFCSVEQTGHKQIQIYRFNDLSAIMRPEDATAADGPQIVLRVPGTYGSGGRCAKIAYVIFAEVVDLLRSYTGGDVVSWLRDTGNADKVNGILADASEASLGPFWVSGGNTSTCYGTEIGNGSNTPVIDLSNIQLLGQWKTNNNFSVGDNATPADLIVTNNATVNGKVEIPNAVEISSNGVNTNDKQISAGVAGVYGGSASFGSIGGSGDVYLTGKLTVGGDIIVGGDAYAPAQITYMDGNGNPQTITVLKKR